ncbi:alpha-E domain-containing protein [Maritalea mediterranea]|uniref:Alpha-E domain-containing protein n=1 Tax=Maritalea mediterranea TaxID=2909667 RepID=A0ABS9E6E7_9HYPH|nr:alpha-E domain-containing protein [Maritalea mediterranea]MCF4097350.1 alpha-E domain-containing protein [Maritalea mediterranea]
MLGKTAGGLYWMFRFLERAENTARLLEAGFRIALTRSTDAESEWRSVIITLAAQQGFEAKYDTYDSTHVINYLLRDADNPSSILSVVNAARDNARLVRTALTSEVWMSVNETWMQLTQILKHQVREVDLPDVLATIRQQAALVRGALNGTMLRTDVYRFCQVGIHIERIDNTARIIDVKYYSLLPATSIVGGRLDNVQWETLLRSVSAHRSFRWAVEDGYTGPAIANFLILDSRLPRSLIFCSKEIVSNLAFIEQAYGERATCHDMADKLLQRFSNREISTIFEEGLHEFISSVLGDTANLGYQIEKDYRFNI